MLVQAAHEPDAPVEPDVELAGGSRAGGGVSEPDALLLELIADLVQVPPPLN